MSSFARPCRYLAVGLLVAVAVGAADRFYVNNQTGNDAFDGRAAAPDAKTGTGPTATITAALAKATVGARVIVANTGRDYRGSVSVAGLRKGRADRPLVLDGNGATVTGLVTVPAARWTLLRDDIYWFENRDAAGKPGPMPNSNWLGHLKHQGWFTEPQAPAIFILNGQPAPHVRDLANIAPGGFFYDTQASPRRLYFRLPAGARLADCTIEIPLNTGVFVDDDYVVVRNLRSAYSQDDGFSGFWGIGVVFENCNGSFNCDQGISLHGTSSTTIDGGVFERNGGCGIADVMSSVTYYRNVTVRDNLITGALFQGLAHVMLGCRIQGNQGCQVSASQGTAVNLTHCLITGETAAGGGNGVSLGGGRLNHCTILNCDVAVAATDRVTVSNSILGPGVRTALALAKTAPERSTIHKCLIAPAQVLMAGKTVTADGGADALQALPWLKDNWCEAVTLAAPDFLLPPEHPRFKAADYNQVLGARPPPAAAWMAGTVPAGPPNP
jgi:hypothetical protein